MKTLAITTMALLVLLSYIAYAQQDEFIDQKINPIGVAELQACLYLWGLMDVGNMVSPNEVLRRALLEHCQSQVEKLKNPYPYISSFATTYETSFDKLKRRMK